MQVRILVMALLAWGIEATESIAQAPPHPDPNKVIIKRERKDIDTMYLRAYEARLKLVEIEGVYIPKDLFDCFKELDKLMEDEVRENFLAFSDEEVDKRTHGSLGVWINHKWSLAEGSRLSGYFTKMGVPHYEYMVGLIIQSYHRHLHKRDLKIKEQVERFRALWNEKQKKEAEDLLKKQE